MLIPADFSVASILYTIMWPAEPKLSGIHSFIFAWNLSAHCGDGSSYDLFLSWKQHDRYQPLLPAAESLHAQADGRAEHIWDAMAFKKKWFVDGPPVAVVPVPCSTH